MDDILILTLGTSPEPIIHCISSLRPQRVLFLCSSETQRLVDLVRAEVPIPLFEAQRDVIVLQQRLSKNDDASIDNEIDQLDRIYLRCLDLFAAIREQHPGSRLIADYTGGTKTMTTGLAMAAIDDGGVSLHLTVSDRFRSSTTTQSYSAPSAINAAAIHARRLRDRELPALMARHDYEAARQAVRAVQRLADPDPATRRWLRRLEDLLVALDAWDRFDHRKALTVLEGLNDRRFDQTLLFPLKRVIGSRRLLDRQADQERWPEIKGHGLEAVEDLLRNAERRAAQERYDDAVGRLYRAMELTAQLLLRCAVSDSVGQSGINTAEVDLDLLPEAIQTRWREQAMRRIGGDSKQAFKIGLSDSYDLLADLGHPVGEQWLKRRSEIVDAIKTRNNSLFAHGFAPIAFRDWQHLHGKLSGFLSQAIELQRARSSAQRLAALPLPQLPSCLEALHAMEIGQLD